MTPSEPWIRLALPAAPSHPSPIRPPASAPLTALAMTLAVQMIAAIAMTSPSVLAPVIAGEIGIGAQHVGWLVSLAYLAAMLSGLAGGWTAQRFGSVRASQGALLASAGGMAMMAAGHPLSLLAGAVVMGVGYGLPNPTAAEILSRHAPTHRRGLFFSIKQTGVPLGVAVTGMLIPALLVVLNWSQAVLALAAAMAVTALMIGPTRRRLESDPARAGAAGDSPDKGAAPATAAAEPVSVPRPGVLRARLIEPLREVIASPPTRRLAITSLVFAFTQVSFLTFLVSLLKLEHRFTLALAASLLAASQAASVVARIGWGHVADRWVDPTRLLGLLGLTMGACIALLGLAPADTPVLAMLAITLACAATAVSWNGVFFADLVRLVPPERVARTTGATQFLTFMGGMTGSAAFAGLVSLSGSYSRVFTALAVLPAVTGGALLIGAASRRRAAPKAH